MNETLNQKLAKIIPQLSPQTPPSQVVLRLTQGAVMTQTIYVATKLGLPDLIAKGITQLNDLAVATNTQADILYRLLRALVSLGIFEETETKQFQLTPLSECLVSDSSDSVRDVVLLLGEVNFGFWNHFRETVQTGESAVRLSRDMSYFDYLAQTPEANQIFNVAMQDLSTRLHTTILASYDFSTVKKLVDVGGGNGSLLGTILLKYPALTGVLFEQAKVLTEAETNLARLGVANRSQIIGGNFFETIPSEGDCYVLMRVLHNWSDNDARTILRNIRQVMSIGGKLIVVERCLPETPEWIMQVSDLTMLLLFGTQERTSTEFEQLFNQTGFTLSQVIRTKSPVSIIEARPI